MKFEIESQFDGSLARAGVIRTAHGNLATPAFVGAATLGAVKALTFAQLDELGAAAILVNTYHLLLRPGLDLLREVGGIHGLSGYGGPMFSDSGGFQIMSLPDVKVTERGVTFKSHIDGAKLEMTPESSMRAQHIIGADIHMAFDCPIGYGDSDNSRANAERTLAITHDWAERSLREHAVIASAAKQSSYETSASASPAARPRDFDAEKSFSQIYESPRRSVAFANLNQKDFSTKSQCLASGEAEADTRTVAERQALFGVVQGGEFADLRRQSAEFMAARDFDGYGIGGMYSSGDEAAEILKVMNQILPASKPRHWLGMGAEPRDLFVGVENGIDTFDCVAPTRQARNGALYTRAGRINILNAKFAGDTRPIDPECGCYTCRHHSRAYLHHLFKAGEISALTLASIHNEYFVINLVAQIRQSIKSGTLAELKNNFLKQYYK